MNEMLEVLLRTTGAFFGVLLLTRILNKEQIGQLTFYEYVTGITIGSMAATIAIDTEVSFWPDMLGLVFWSALTYLMGYAALVSRPARKLLEGEPTVVIHNGKILEQNMGKMRYNLDDLMVQLRNKSAFNIADVEFAVLEPNGDLSVLLKSQNRPLTPSDLQVPTQYEGISTELIMDGEIIQANLAQLQLDQHWLVEELHHRGIYDLQEVSFASLDAAGHLYIDVKHDHLVNPTDASDHKVRGDKDDYPGT